MKQDGLSCFFIWRISDVGGANLPYNGNELSLRDANFASKLRATELYIKRKNFVFACFKFIQVLSLFKRTDFVKFG